MDDLRDMYFRRSKCNDHSTDGQLQGEALAMDFDQHAGLYLLLVVGIIACVLLMLVEHETFKWMVPYWRRKPTDSFWKSPSMMFWSQRLHRIITSEQLVSPHHSAREMIEVMKNRDFTKLFQKNVKKQEKIARNRKNLFSVVEQLKWKAMPSQSAACRKSGLACDFSTESPQDTKASPSRDKPWCNKEDMMIHSEEARATATDEQLQCVTVGSIPGPLRSSLKLDFDRAKVRRQRHQLYSRTIRHHHSTIDENDLTTEDPQPPETERPTPTGLSLDDRCPLSTGLNTSQSWSPGIVRNTQDLEFSGKGAEHRSRSVDDRMTSSVDFRLPVARALPNGDPLLSPNRNTLRRKRSSPSPNRWDAFASPSNPEFVSNKRDDLVGRKTTSLSVRKPREELDKTGDKVHSALSRRKTVDVPRSVPERQPKGTYRKPGNATRITLRCLSKEELLHMWKASEKALNRQLKEALRQTEELQKRIRPTDGQTVT